MPHFYFNIHDGASSPDQDGIELPDLDTVQLEAVSLVGGLLQDQGRGFAPIAPLAVDVIDGEGIRVLRVEVGLIHRGSTHGRPGPSMAPFLK